MIRPYNLLQHSLYAILSFEFFSDLLELEEHSNAHRDFGEGSFRYCP